MNVAATTTAAEQHAESPLVLSEVSALERDVRWEQANEEQRAVLKRIAAQRDRLAAARQAQLQAKGMPKPVATIPANAPFAERMAAFAAMHPIATAAAAGVALLIGPRKLIRYGSLLLPLVAKFKR